MKSFGGLLLVLLLVVNASAASRPRVAVLDFEVAGDATVRDAGRAASALMESAMAERCSVVERSYVQDKSQSAGCVSGRPISYQKLRQLGVELGAHYLVTGTVVKYGNIMLVARLVRAQTGDAVTMARIEGRTINDLQPLMRSLATQLCAAMPEVPGPDTSVVTLRPSVTPDMNVVRAQEVLPATAAWPRTIERTNVVAIPRVIEAPRATESAVLPAAVVAAPTPAAVVTVTPPTPAVQTDSTVVRAEAVSRPGQAYYSRTGANWKTVPGTSWKTRDGTLVKAAPETQKTTTTTGTALPAAPPPSGDVSSAFSLMQKAERQVTSLGHAGVIRIVSEHDAKVVMPTRWIFYFYDPSATFKCRMVVMDYGKVTRVDTDKPNYLLVPYDQSHVIQRDRLRIDSDAALTIAKSMPQLQNITISEAGFELRRSKRHDNSGEWHIEMQQRLANGKDRNIGWVRVDAETGSVTGSDLSVRH